MFGIIADFVAAFTTILFPVFASYKALRTSDPAQLTPWLIYWVILSLFLLVESWTVFIIGWLPFYSWIRLFALSYLVLPQTQGAKLLYTSYVEPFITSHERQIEDFIGHLHEKGSKAGLHYLHQVIDLIRQHLFGLPPTAQEHPPPPQPTSAASYAQSLLSRFAMPSARAPTPSDLYSLLSSAVAAATTTTAQSPSSNSPSKTPSSTKPALFPTNITTPADKQSFLTTQREKIAVLMRALDREQRDLDLAYGNAPPSSEVEADIERRMKDLSDSDGVEMRKNKSNNSFQNIEREELEEDGGDKEQGGGVPPPEKTKRQAVPNTSGRATSGSWNPTTWFSSAAGTATGTEDDGGVGGGVAKEVREAVQGMSSSIDR